MKGSIAFCTHKSAVVAAAATPAVSTAAPNQPQQHPPLPQQERTPAAWATLPQFTQLTAPPLPSRKLLCAQSVRGLKK